MLSHFFWPSSFAEPPSEFLIALEEADGRHQLHRWRRDSVNIPALDPSVLPTDANWDCRSESAITLGLITGPSREPQCDTTSFDDNLLPIPDQVSG